MQTITAKCRLDVPPSDIKTVEETFHGYADACTFLNRIAAEAGISNAIKLHHLAYRETRERFSLSANLTVTAIRRVCGNIKATGHKDRQYRPTSVSLDARVFSFREKDWTVSFTTIQGRVRCLLRIGEYQRRLLAGNKPTFATLVRTKKGFAINICIEVEPEALNPNASRVLGIDCGIKRLAVASTGKIWSSENLLKVRDQFARVRASLQSKGTKGAKRVLKRLSGRESRYCRWVNHNVSKEIIALAINRLCNRIALEDLTHIRSRARRWSKHSNRILHSWAFGELQGFIQYKAALKGIETLHVKPRGTSKTCHRCGQPGERIGQKFVCTGTCRKFSGDSDVNAAKNIAARGAACKPARESTLASATHLSPVESSAL